MELNSENQVGAQIWFDNTLLNGSTGIAQDANSIFIDLQKNFQVEYLPKECGISRKNSFYRKFLGLLFIVFGKTNKLPSKLSGIFYQPQINFNVPGKNITDWFIRIHDIFPLTNPEWFKNTSVRQFDLAWKNATESSAIFVCSSRYMKELILQLYPELKDRVEVVECTPREFVQTYCNRCSACKIIGTDLLSYKFFLSVGTIEPRKNYHFLITNWTNYQKLNNSQSSLIIVGGKGWKSKKERKLLRRSKVNFSGGILWLSSCCDAQLVKIYRSAAAYISTSLDEGFNLPALEARVKFSLPLILSDIPVHRELHGEIANFYKRKEDFFKCLENIPDRKIEQFRVFKSANASMTLMLKRRLRN
jgi:glycosyltransferase involved in cell wall biosynthesis